MPALKAVPVPEDSKGFNDDLFNTILAYRKRGSGKGKCL